MRNDQGSVVRALSIIDERNFRPTPVTRGSRSGAFQICHAEPGVPARLSREHFVYVGARAPLTRIARKSNKKHLANKPINRAHS